MSYLIQIGKHFKPLNNQSNFKHQNASTIEVPYNTFKSAPAQNTLGTKLRITITLAEESLLMASRVFCNPLKTSFPMAFFASGLSKPTSKIPVIEYPIGNSASVHDWLNEFNQTSMSTKGGILNREKKCFFNRF